MFSMVKCRLHADLYVKVRDDGSCSYECASAQSMSKKKANARNLPSFICKIKECYVAKVQKIKEHVIRSL